MNRPEMRVFVLRVLLSGKPPKGRFKIVSRSKLIVFRNSLELDGERIPLTAASISPPDSIFVNLGDHKVRLTAESLIESGVPDPNVSRVLCTVLCHLVNGDETLAEVAARRIKLIKCARTLPLAAMIMGSILAPFIILQYGPFSVGVTTVMAIGVIVLSAIGFAAFLCISKRLALQCKVNSTSKNGLSLERE